MKEATSAVATTTEPGAMGTGQPNEATFSKDDAAWVLTNAVLILTMQSGFGLLEAGFVSAKNTANIMVKNVIDVGLGGLVYWAVGYGLSFGQPSTWFCGLGNFFIGTVDDALSGSLYTHYVFHFSFASTATTIVSGAVAERMRLSAYIIFSLFSTLAYCFVASWAWNDVGFLRKLGFFDFAGAGVVHAFGGANSLVAAVMLGARLGRFDGGDADERDFGMVSPVSSLTGTMMLWWAWLGFNCGSTFGVGGELWHLAAKVGVNTLNGSIGGCTAALLTSVVVHRNSHYDISFLMTGVLAGLVGVTAGCSVLNAPQSLLVGAVAAVAAIAAIAALERLRIDDPVGAAPVHLVGGAVGVIAVGLFGHEKGPFDQLGGHKGLLCGGGFYLLGIQSLGLVCIVVWSFLTAGLCFAVLKYTIGIRMRVDEELPWRRLVRTSTALVGRVAKGARSTIDRRQRRRSAGGNCSSEQVVAAMSDSQSLPKKISVDTLRLFPTSSNRRLSLGNVLRTIDAKTARQRGSSVGLARGLAITSASALGGALAQPDGASQPPRPSVLSKWRRAKIGVLGISAPQKTVTFKGKPQETVEERLESVTDAHAK